jgi:hypothetical protein
LIKNEPQNQASTLLLLLLLAKAVTDIASALTFTTCWLCLLVVIDGGPIDSTVLEILSIMVTVFSRATLFFVVVVTGKI